MTHDLGQPGQILDGKYRIIRLLGSGGMGAVFEGENLRIRRRVAIKMLHKSASSLAEAVMRFEREAQAAALVGSDHICDVLDLGELPDRTRYMVMEYLEGETLSRLIERSGRLLPLTSTPIMLQVLEALSAAHAVGIVHRDLKPDNIFILPTKNGIKNFAKILDFGVSKFSQIGGAMNVTRDGAVVGTPYYMSPEQARGTSAVDQRTDVYALGVVLFQATTGQVPYQAETFNELLFKIVLEVAPPPQTYVPDLDPEFAAIIQQAMSRDPAHRYQTCAQFRDALLAYQAARQPQVFPGLPPGIPCIPLINATQVLDRDAAASSRGAVRMPDSRVTAGRTVLTGGASDASWAGSGPVTGGAPLATSNAWGDASSPHGVPQARPRGTGTLVVASAMAIGLAVGAGAFILISGHRSRSKMTVAATEAVAAPSAPSAPSVTPPSIESASAGLVSPTPSQPVEAQAASARVAVTAAPASPSSVVRGRPGSRLIGGALPKTGDKPAPTKPAGNDLGY